MAFASVSGGTAFETATATGTGVGALIACETTSGRTSVPFLTAESMAFASVSGGTARATLAATGADTFVVIAGATV